MSSMGGKSLSRMPAGGCADSPHQQLALTANIEFSGCQGDGERQGLQHQWDKFEQGLDKPIFRPERGEYDGGNRSQDVVSHGPDQDPHRGQRGEHGDQIEKNLPQDRCIGSGGL